MPKEIDLTPLPPLPPVEAPLPPPLVTDTHTREALVIEADDVEEEEVAQEREVRRRG